MTDSKTATELLKELSALSCDFSEEEIRTHSVISVKQGSYNRMYCLDLNRKWLDAWHREFDRITQAIAATLGSGECENEWEQFGGFRCSKCWMQINAISTNETEPMPIRFCPSCGRKVTGDD